MGRLKIWNDNAGEWQYVVSPPSGGSQPFLQTDPLPISSAQILALNSSPIEVVPAPGAGFALYPLAGTWVYIAGATPYDADHNLTIDWEGDTSGLVSMNGALFRSVDCLSISTGSAESRKPLTVCEDKALVLQEAESAPLDGNGTGIVQVTYMVIPLTA